MVNSGEQPTGFIANKVEPIYILKRENMSQRIDDQPLRNFLLVLLILFFSSSCLLSQHETIKKTETIVFLHTNDHHFDINLPEALTAKVEEIRSSYDHVFLLDAGDILVRHPHRWIDNGTAMESSDWYYERAVNMVEAMNGLRYDAMTLGNHEFDYIEGLTLSALQAAKFPLLSANVSVSTPLFPVPESHLMIQTSTGTRIALLGLSVTSGSKEGIEQHDIFETARTYRHLRDESDIFVALTHIGLAHDATLAEEFPEIDIIIGGHSHHLIEEAVVVNGVLIAQAGGNPHVVSDDHPVYLGKIIVTLENGVITDKRGQVIIIQ